MSNNKDIVQCPRCDSIEELELLRSDYDNTSNPAYHVLVKCKSCGTIWHEVLKA